MNDHTMLDEALLGACPSLKAIVFLGTGAASYIDLAAAERQGIRVRAYGGYGDQSVAEHAVALMFAAARRLAAMDRALREGHWEPLNGIELAGRTLGVIGTGGIGRAMVAARRRARHARDRLEPERRAGGPALHRGRARRAAAHRRRGLAPPRPERGHPRLPRRPAVGLLKPGAILINTARGALVDEVALVAALEAGRIGHAGLDVFKDEPLPEGHPLTRLPNVTLTAHAAFATREASERLLRMALELLAEERRRLA